MCPTTIAVNESGTPDPIAEATVTYTIDGEENTGQTNSSGRLYLGDLRMGSTVDVMIEKQYYHTLNDSIFLDEWCSSSDIGLEMIHKGKGPSRNDVIFGLQNQLENTALTLRAIFFIISSVSNKYSCQGVGDIRFNC